MSECFFMNITIIFAGWQGRAKWAMNFPGLHKHQPSLKPHNYSMEGSYGNPHTQPVDHDC